MSEQINELATALCKAQGAMRAAQKDRENPFFKSSYATLASVIDAIREPFLANGLSFVQPTRLGEDGAVLVETVLLHASGQWISGEVSARPVKSDPQGVGSLISYLRRYGLQAMVGIASTDDDDDGNAATKPHLLSAPVKGYSGTPEQKKALMKILGGMGVDESVWEKVFAKMQGRASADVKHVVQEVLDSL